MSKIAIITPLYNREQYISETIDSVINQSYSNWELIIVDDGSTDNGPDIVKRYSQQDKRIIYLKREQLPKGPSHCRNIGANYTDADFVVFLDSDDLLHPECIENRIKKFNENPLFDFLVFPLQRFVKIPGDRTEIFNSYYETEFEYFLAFLRDQTPWQTTCPLWKRNSFLKIGGFNTEYLRLTDPELHTNAIISGLQFKVIQDVKPDAFYRASELNASETIEFWNNSILYRIKFICEIIPRLNSKPFNDIEIYMFRKSLKLFVNKLFKIFLIYRIENYTSEAKHLIHFSYHNKIISLKTRFLVFVLLISIKVRFITRFLKIKALVIKLI